MSAFSLLIAGLLVSAALLPGTASGAESPLAIVDAGVQQSEDAPFVPPDYQFLPGEFVYFTFQVAGFSVKAEGSDEVRRIALSYEITPQDANGVALAPADTSTVRVELNPEDKNWMPKRRVSFLLPPFIAAGEFRIHLRVKDLFGNTETSRDYPFHVGGVAVRASGSITVQNLRFLRQENDREPLEVPAYRPGDTVYANFEMVGYQIGPHNEHNVAYGITVLRPNGKPFLEQPKAAEFEKSTFYPAQFIPGTFSVTTSSDTPRGAYVLILTVRDLIGKQTYETKQAFSIE